MFQILQPYIGEFLTAFSTALVLWLFNRHKQKSEITTTDIDNGAKVVDLYKGALDDLGSRYESKYTSIVELFDKKEAILMQEIDHLKKQLTLYKKMYDDKVKEFNKYKKEHP
jgi:hypothetical protein